MATSRPRVRLGLDRVSAGGWKSPILAKEGEGPFGPRDRGRHRRRRSVSAAVLWRRRRDSDTGTEGETSAAGVAAARYERILVPIVGEYRLIGRVGWVPEDRPGS